MKIKQLWALILAGAVVCAAPALAQEEAAPATPAPADLAVEDVSQGMVVSFVNAMILVERVRGAYLEAINKAENEEQVNALIAEADKVAIEAVGNVRGITPGEYLAIARLLPESPELQSLVGARVEELRAAQKSKTAPAAGAAEE